MTRLHLTIVCLALAVAPTGFVRGGDDLDHFALRMRQAVGHDGGLERDDGAPSGQRANHFVRENESFLPPLLSFANQPRCRASAPSRVASNSASGPHAWIAKLAATTAY